MPRRSWDELSPATQDRLDKRWIDQDVYEAGFPINLNVGRSRQDMQQSIREYLRNLPAGAPPEEQAYRQLTRGRDLRDVDYAVRAARVIARVGRDGNKMLVLKMQLALKKNVKRLPDWFFWYGS